MTTQKKTRKDNWIWGDNRKRHSLSSLYVDDDGKNNKKQFALTLITLSSSTWQELWSVTSATFPAWVTMNTFITCDTWRPVSTAVFISSQFYLMKEEKKWKKWVQMTFKCAISETNTTRKNGQRTFEIGKTDWMSSFCISSFKVSFFRCSSCGWMTSVDRSLAFGPSWT